MTLFQVTRRVNYALLGDDKMGLKVKGVYKLLNIRHFVARGVQPLGMSVIHWKKKSCLGPHFQYIATWNHKKYLIMFSVNVRFCRVALPQAAGGTPL